MVEHWYVVRTKVQHLIAAWENCKRQGRQNCHQELVDTAVHDLLDFLLNTYRENVTAADIRTVFNRNSLEIEDLPPRLVPVAVMREVLNVHRVTFDPEIVKIWTRFTNRYGRYIISA